MTEMKQLRRLQSAIIVMLDLVSLNPGQQRVGAGGQNPDLAKGRDKLGQRRSVIITNTI